MTSTSPTLLPTIRTATPDDAEHLAPLAKQLGYASTPEEIRRRLAALGSRNDHIIYVAERDGTILGWLHAHVHHTITDDTSAEIAGLVVDECDRGTGIGRMLMAAAEDWARSHGCRSVRLRSNVVRDRAHEFYKRLGYEVTKTQHAFRKPV